ncbi:phosphoadenosine phosphosulfate reductase family protein [Croceicoccus gelatinilyticus]|uniref:phosphoadenosine phosphosulfate reductase domain-containing protein n=1 Tax=Croceicoccus gelatinilyticus TaxID=2835536 RepID=UPI001BCC5C3E|nr:phosphoadenosine phosphosulfate reductase family protein [Croceicoccus gelatinilyticus]MBS7671368.1 phosphoadenosine phosphosulfate reductase family protein [Croceicoccus gelatinilyticus]
MSNLREPAFAGYAEMERLAREGAWFAFSCSAGKDSAAAMLHATRYLDTWGHPKSRRFVIHADLGRSEWKSTKTHVEYLAAFFGLPLQIVAHKTHDMLSRWQRRGDLGRQRWAAYETLRLIGPWSSSSSRFCTSEMKGHVMGAVKAKLDGPVVSVLGLRRDESIGRRATPIVKPDTSMGRFGRRQDDFIWNPIAEWSAQDVFAAHEAAGLALHEAYPLGATRLSCNFCVLASINDLTVASGHLDNHETYRELVAMECSYGFAFQPSRWLGDVAPSLLSTGLQRDLTGAKRHAEERRSIEAAYPVGMTTKPYSAITRADAEIVAQGRARIAESYRICDAVIDPAVIASLHCANVQGKEKA